MKLLKIYLDTSVINFLFADDSPEKKEITVDFFDNFVRAKKYEVYISSVVVDEINATKDSEKRKQLLDVLNQYPLHFVSIELTEDVKFLAKLYITNQIIPTKKLADALHVAISVINEMDILLSWNYKHLANINRKRQINLINSVNNYLHPLEIVTPLEVIDYENE